MNVIILIGDILKSFFSIVLLLVIGSSILSGCITDDDDEKTIVDTAIENGSFTLLVTALEAAGLVDTLNGEGPFTVFAPTDDAFEDLPEGVLDALLADIDALTDVLTYHVVSGELESGDVVSSEMLESLQGEMIDVMANGGVKVNDANVTQTDILCSNGVIHVIDKVILPPSMVPKTIVETAIENGNFTTLVSAVVAAGLDGTLSGDGPFTVFAPTDDAFDALPDGVLDGLVADKTALTNVLTYHVLSGELYSTDIVNRNNLLTLQGENIEVTTNGAVMVNNAKVSIADIECSNGIIHVIDAVILPPSMTMPNVYDCIKEDSRLSTLGTAIGLAGLDDALKGEGPFTVFAPSNDAFNMLPEDFLNGLVADVDALTDVLLFHVIPSTYYSSNVAMYDEIPTPNLYGGYISLDDYGGLSFVETDIECSNGVVHIINRVLIPEEYLGPGTIVEEAMAIGDFTTLLAALELSGLDETLSGEGPFTVIAPSDHAFSILPEGALDALLADVDELTDVLLYHVIGGEYTIDELVNMGNVETLLGPELIFTLSAHDRPMVNHHVIIIVDIMCSNGIIHMVHMVLMPP